MQELLKMWPYSKALKGQGSLRLADKEPGTSRVPVKLACTLLSAIFLDGGL